MNRIRQTLRLRKNRKLLVPFFTVGYPDYATSLRLVRAAIEAGADVVELGMPFSDPMADGPDIQLSSQVALQQGVTLKKVLSAVMEIRKSSDIPIVLMGYFNPVYAFGVSDFLAKAAAAGVDGLIIPDLPVDEAGSFRALAERNDISTIFLVSPTSSPERIQRVARACPDFVYAVTVTGVTGGKQEFSTATDTYLKMLHRNLKRPFVAGFGVSSAATAQRLARWADGVVIGSALIRTFSREKTKRQGIEAMSRLLRSIRKVLR